ncbi:MAG TPA: SDR family NAD(P)-dependent oxidoreductase [Propionibacteriaceae bacterium]
MARVVITGSADGLGRETAQSLLDQGHDVILHARDAARLEVVRPMLDRGAGAVTGDLSDLNQVRSVADQVSRLGHVDAVIHNAGVYGGRLVLPVNVVAPYLLTVLLPGVPRLVYLSSGMHRGGDPSLSQQDWAGDKPGSYSDSKLFVTALALAIARLRPEVASNAVDPGWVPTKMGGAGAPDDLQLGHLTQEWLATSDEPEARSSGGYWFHRRRQPPHAAAQEVQFQDRLIATLEAVTGESFGP